MSCYYSRLELERMMVAVWKKEDCNVYTQVFLFFFALCKFRENHLQCVMTKDLEHVVIVVMKHFCCIQTCKMYNNCYNLVKIMT